MLWLISNISVVPHIRFIHWGCFTIIFKPWCHHLLSIEGTLLNHSFFHYRMGDNNSSELKVAVRVNVLTQAGPWKRSQKMEAP